MTPRPILLIDQLLNAMNVGIDSDEQATHLCLAG